MATATTIPTSGDDDSPARISVARYQKMIEAGILTSEDKVELLEHYVVLKMPRTPPHDGTIDVVDAALSPLIPKGWRLRCHLSLVLADSQPEPDFTIVRGDARTYLTRHPTAADAAVVIEVADSSLLRDQRDKTRIYARAGIPCYWIVNLVDHRIEVYTQPTGPTATPEYQSVQNFQPGDTVTLTLDSAAAATVPVASLLP